MLNGIGTYKYVSNAQFDGLSTHKENVSHRAVIAKLSMGKTYVLSAILDTELIIVAMHV